MKVFFNDFNELSLKGIKKNLVGESLTLRMNFTQNVFSKMALNFQGILPVLGQTL